MEKKFKRTTVTSALPYANGPVHIGHLAGVYDRRLGRARRAHHHPRQEGRMHAAGHRGPLSHAHPRLVQGVRHLVRCVRAYHFEGAPRHGIGILPYPLRQGRVRRKDLDAILRRGSKDFPCRPLHHGRMSALPRRGRLRRPVREVRFHALAYRTYQPEECHQRKPAGNEGNQALVPAARQARGMAAPVDSGRPQGMAPQRVPHLSATSRTPRNCCPTRGRNGGKTPKHASYTLSARTTSCSTASCSPPC